MWSRSWSYAWRLRVDSLVNVARSMLNLLHRPKAPSRLDQRVELVLRQHRHAQFLRLVEFAARLLAGDDIVRLLRHTARRLPAQCFDEIFDLRTLLLQRPGDDE